MTQREKFIVTAYSMIGKTKQEIKDLWDRFGLTGWDGEWCSEFVSVCACAAGLSEDIIIGSYSRTMWDKYKSKGETSGVPEAGDLVFFAYGSNVDHVGIVAKVDGLNITVIEANIYPNKSMVTKNTYKRTTSCIFGYACPLERDDEIMTKLPTLKKGSEGNEVKNLQALLNVYMTKGVSPLKVDGKFGVVTQARLKAYQTARKAQKSAYIKTADGICGAETWSDLLLS